MRPQPEVEEAEEPDHQEFEAYDDQLDDQRADLDGAVGSEAVAEKEEEEASNEDAPHVQAEALLRLLLDEIISVDGAEGAEAEGPEVLQGAAALPAETPLVDLTASCAAAPALVDPPASSQTPVATLCHENGACSQTMSDHDLEQLVSQIEDPALVQEIIDSLVHESQMAAAQPDGNANGQVTVPAELVLIDTQPEEAPSLIPDQVDLFVRNDEKDEVSKDDMDDKEKLASAARGIVI